MSENNRPQPYDELNNIEESLRANSRYDPQLSSITVEFTDKNGVTSTVKKSRGYPLYINELPFLIEWLLDTIENFGSNYGKMALEHELHDAHNILTAIANAKKMGELEKIVGAIKAA